MRMGDQFEKALVYAVRLHADQKRKGTEIPYIAHLLSVTALVLENGGNEDEAIGALLHDAVEDQGGIPVLEEIREIFGVKVAAIVDGCTDAYEKPKPPWRQRKEQYLTRLIQAPEDVRRVSLADKLHNARSLLEVLQSEGSTAWDRFKGGREGTLWYYQSLVEVFQSTGKDAMTVELSRTVDSILSKNL